MSNLDSERFTELLNDAIERHIKFYGTWAHVIQGTRDTEGLTQGVIDVPVDVGWATIPDGLYLFREHNGDLDMGSPIFECLINADDVAKMNAPNINDDTTILKAIEAARKSARPYDLKGKPVEAGYVFVGLAAYDAITAGDTEALEKFSEILSTARDRWRHTNETTVPIPQLEAIKPRTHYAPNAKTTEVLTEPVLFDNTATLEVGKKVGQLTIDFGLGWSDGEAPANIDISHPIDKEDVRVIASVVTLKEAGNTTVSPFQIAETMGYSNPPVELQAEIHERVMKLRQIDGRIDWTEQARRYGINNPDTGKPFEHAEITGHLIDCTVFNGTDTDGKRYIRYQLLSDPITYQHASKIGQVVQFPQRLVSLKPVEADGRVKARVSREQAQVRDAILWYVFSLSNPKNRLSATITYDKLFNRAGVDTSTAKRRKSAVKFTNDYLRALMGAGVIKAFSVNAPGRSHKPISVQVFVSKQRRR